MSIRPGYCPHIQGTMMTHHSGALQDDGRWIVSARPQPVDAGDRHYSPLFSILAPHCSLRHSLLAPPSLLRCHRARE